MRAVVIPSSSHMKLSLQSRVGPYMHDAIASTSCIDKVLQASIAICGFKRTLQKFPTSTRTGNSGAFWRHFSGFFGHFRVVSTCIAGSKVKDGTMDSRRAPQMRSRHTFPPAGPKEGRVSRPPFYQCTPIPRDAMPACLSYFRLLAMASPYWMLVGSY